MATIFQKPGADKCLILEPGEALLREMALPTQWTQIRLAFGLSITTAASNDANCVNETLSYINPLSSFIAGIKDGSLIAPGRDGSRFIGIRPTIAGNTIGSGQLASGHTLEAIATNNLSIAASAGIYAGLNFTANGSGTTAFGAIFSVCITIVNATVTVGYAMSSATADFSDAALKAALLTATPYTSAAVAGWWTSGATPEVRHIYLRSPFLNNRFRVHNYGYMVIS